MSLIIITNYILIHIQCAISWCINHRLQLFLLLKNKWKFFAYCSASLNYLISISPKCHYSLSLLFENLPLRLIRYFSCVCKWTQFTRHAQRTQKAVFSRVDLSTSAPASDGKKRYFEMKWVERLHFAKERNVTTDLGLSHIGPLRLQGMVPLEVA